MTLNLVTAFEYFMTTATPLEDKDRQEAYRILVEESYDDFLEFLYEKGSIPKSAYDFLIMDMYQYEVNEKGEYLNYYEIDFDKRNKLIEKVFEGTEEEYAEEYAKQYEEEE